MSPSKRKKAKVKAKMSRQEKLLSRSGLVKEARLTDAQRKKLAKLTTGEVKALMSVKRKLSYKGSLHVGRGRGRGIIF
jgi:hypothetical protein